MVPRDVVRHMRSTVSPAFPSCPGHGGLGLEAGVWTLRYLARFVVWHMDCTESPCSHPAPGTGCVGLGVLSGQGRL